MKSTFATTMAAIAWVSGMLVCAGARADAVDVANGVRARGCGAHTGLGSTLRRSTPLAEAARSVARGRELREALALERYRPGTAAVLHFEGSYSDYAFAAALSKDFCSQLMDPAVSDVGTFGGPAGVWIIVARHSEDARAAPVEAASTRALVARTPAQPMRPTALDVESVERELFARINAARARGQRCGDEAFGAAPPLEFVPPLERVAAEHSQDMARHHEFDHAGHDGSTPSERVHRTGFPARLIGENIAYGAMSPSDAVAGWLASPGHCENIMDPRFTETGIAVAQERGGAGIYFTEVFVQPTAPHAEAGRP